MIIIPTITLIFSQIDKNKIQRRPPIGHLLFTSPILLKNKTDFPVVINLPQCFTATISAKTAKLRRDVFSAVSHNIRIAGGTGHVRSFAMSMNIYSGDVVSKDVLESLRNLLQRGDGTSAKK